MNEFDKTMIGQFNLPAEPESLWQRYRLLFIGAGGAALLLLCMGLLVGVGYFLGNMNAPDQSGQPVAGAFQPTPTPNEPAATTTPTAAPQLEPTAEQPAEPDIPTPTPPPAEPEFGAITFALDVTDTLEPVDPSGIFEAGITDIHAVFTYKNLSPDYVWERVWYHDGEELLRNVENWSGDESGQFDYFLDTGGTALPAGRWLLELYLEGEMLASGEFSIEAEKIVQKPAATATATPSPTSAPTATPTPRPVSVNRPAKTYQLVYSKWDGGVHNIYIADTNGQNEQLLIKRAAGPSWSVDGKQLFFFGEQGVTQQMQDGRAECEFGAISGGIVAIDLPSPLSNICVGRYGPWTCERKEIDVQAPASDVCERDGLKVFQNLDWKEGSARWASVAPDGQSVAYDAKPGNDYRIYFRSIFDNQQFRFELPGEQADWSPDSQRLVYRSGRDNKAGIWMSNRDDTGHTLITQNGSDSFPAMSPDGHAIAFSRRVYGNVDIYTVNMDGSNLQRLTDHPGHDTLPAYTPGGEIIFRSDRAGRWGIWKMRGSGANQIEIIPKANVGPDWAYSKMDVR